MPPGLRGDSIWNQCNGMRPSAHSDGSFHRVGILFLTKKTLIILHTKLDETLSFVEWTQAEKKNIYKVLSLNFKTVRLLGYTHLRQYIKVSTQQKLSRHRKYNIIVWWLGLSVGSGTVTSKLLKTTFQIEQLYEDVLTRLAENLLEIVHYLFAKKS